MKYKDLTAITITEKIEKMKHHYIEGANIILTKYSDGTIGETKNMNDVVIMRFNKPVLIDDEGNLSFTYGDNKDAIHPNQSIKISNYGVEII